MKKFILILPLMFVFVLTFPQSIKRITDPHIRAQQERMVFKKWGDWLPKKKFFLGVQINVHHTMTWGWMAPNQNKRYMEGSDIRPLGPRGEQTQRMALTTTMLTQSNRFKEHSDELGNTAVSELYNHTGGVISEVDPLWQLYYKRTLRDVKDYNLSEFVGKLNPKQRLYMTETGVIKWFDDEMLRLNERLNGAFNTTMDRGSRIINYHRILLEYEKILNEWQTHTAWAETLLKIRDSGKNNRSGNDLNAVVWNTTDDRALMAKIINEAKKL